MLQADTSTTGFQGYWPSFSPARARTRVMGFDEPLEAASRSPAASSSRTPSGSSCSHGETASGRQKVTNLRLPGQYDERLFAAAGLTGLQGPYYNWNRWYLPGVGRYLELDPLALRGKGDGLLEWYAYANGNPLTRFDPTGEQSVSDYANCILHPLDCAQGKDCAEKAFQATLRRFGRQGHNNGGDAFRHCFWNCCMAQKMGAHGAKRIGDSHENWDGNPSCEKDMDQANNNTGRKLGTSNPGGDCAQLCGGAPLQPQPNPPCNPCKKDYGNY